MINVAAILTAISLVYAIAGNIPSAIVLGVMAAAIIIYWR